MFLLPLVLILAGCGGSDAERPSAAAPPLGDAIEASAGEPLAGVHTFVLVPEESEASYLADEEFFAGALSKLGISAGRITVVGSTRAVEGRFQLDSERPTDWLGENTFTVRMDTFTTDQPRRDGWIREDGPRFNDYPLATFNATAVREGNEPVQAGDEFSLDLLGTLTIREISQPATFAVRGRLVDDTLTGTANARVLMSDFGIEPLEFYNTLSVADEIGLELRFTARAAPSGTEPSR